MITGCPVIVLDNGCGIGLEGLPVLLCNTVTDVVWTIKELCDTPTKASAWSVKHKNFIEEEFSMVKVCGRWDAFMKEMT
jgi:hypothetical protein